MCRLISKTTKRGVRGGKISKTSIGFFNAQSIRNKTDVIHDYILEKNLDICAIVETWLKQKDELIAQFITPIGYDILHIDREHKQGGGVAVVFKSVYQAKLDIFTVARGRL